MSDEVRKVDRAHEERLRDAGKEKIKPRPKETEFDKALEKSRMPAQLGTQQQAQSKTLTEDAIREAVKHDDRQKDEGHKDKDEGKKDNNPRGKEDRSDNRIIGQKVVAKETLKRDGGGGGGDRGSFGGGASRRELSKVLIKSGAKSLPIDLQSKFASKLADSLKTASVAGKVQIPEELLNKIVQYVRIGINRKGEKEIQLDLHEKIFRGLKLKVSSHGGRVSVHFRTSDAKGKTALEDNEEEIKSLLSSKGIDVDDISIS